MKKQIKVYNKMFLINNIRLFLFFTLFALLNIKGQISSIQIPKIIPPSPTAQNFMRYGEIPVDFSTGVPNINIPIYQINGKHLSIPISISYHASGIKVNDIASEIGLGWVLNSGGTLSRTINAERDEKNEYRTYYNAAQILNDINTKSYLYSCSSQSLTGANILNDFLTNSYPNEDQISDRYFYQLPGGESGVFRYDFSVPNSENSVVTLPYRPIKIKKTIATPNQTIVTSFEITDERGIIYTFENVVQNNVIPSVWYITNISSADGVEKIKFNYGQQSPDVVFSRKSFIYQSGVENYNANNCNPLDVSSSVSAPNSVNQTFTIPLITSIESNNEIINFTYDNRSDFTQLKRLKEIVISLKKDPTIIQKKIQFFEKYFGSTAADKRLALDYIITSSVGSLELEKYLFKYNEAVTLPEYPEKMASARYREDLWGYYNAINNKDNIHNEFISKVQDRQYYGGIRDADSNVGSAGMLQEIKYPTGGKTVFEFERHYDDNLYTYRLNAFQRGGYVGGFRVKKISNYKSDDAIPEIKTYLYSNALFVRPKAEYFSYDQRFAERIENNGIPGSGNPPTSCWTDYKRQIVYSEPFLPLEIAPGLAIAYGSVTETLGTPTNNIGKTVYQYNVPESSSDYYSNGEHPNQFEAEWYYHPYHYDKGNYSPKLGNKEIYDSNGKKVYEEFYKYSDYFNTSFNTGIKFTRTKIFDPFYFEVSYSIPGSNPCCYCNAPLTTCNAGGNCIGMIQDFIGSVVAIDTKAYSKAKLLEYSLTKTYNKLDPTKYVSDSIHYSYNQHNLMIKETSKLNTLGQNVLTKYKYPYDFASTEPYQTMLNKRILTPVIEEQVTNNNKQIQKMSTVYKNWGNNIIEPEYIKGQTDAQNSFENRVRYSAYDNKGNPLSLKKEDGTPVSYLWGYNKTLPIAMVENSNYVEQNFIDTQNHGSLFFMQPMNRGQNYTIGSFTLAQSKIVSLLRQYTKNNDHEATFHVSINGPSAGLSQFNDLIPKSSTGMSFTTSNVSLPAGTYTITMNAGYGVGEGSQYQHDIDFVIVSNTEVNKTIPFHTSFEEDTLDISMTQFKTGKKSHVGSYNVNLPASSLGYDKVRISYWGKSSASSPWQYFENIVDTGYGIQYTVGSSMAFVDEVRVYPIDAMMSTYTYNPFYKVQTSIMKQNNQTEYYEYDNSGKLKEVYIMEGDIKKTIKIFDHHYKQ